MKRITISSKILGALTGEKTGISGSKQWKIAPVSVEFSRFHSFQLSASEYLICIYFYIFGVLGFWGFIK
jgi:hypothetical protein